MACHCSCHEVWRGVVCCLSVGDLGKDATGLVMFSGSRQQEEELGSDQIFRGEMQCYIRSYTALPYIRNRQQGVGEAGAEPHARSSRGSRSPTNCRR